VPFNAEDYVHRIGRTGRAGATGRAFTMVTPADEKALGNIHRLIGRDIAVLPLEGQPTENEKVEVPAVQQKERRPNRQEKQRTRRREPAEDPDEEVNTGSFGDDIPSFLQKR
jgi:superfamily II DNA/RNA helicase